jgi:hypothetical protein
VGRQCDPAFIQGTYSIFHVAEIEGRSYLHRRAAQFCIPFPNYDAFQSLSSIKQAKKINTAAKSILTNVQWPIDNIEMNFGWGPESYMYALLYGTPDVENGYFSTPLSASNDNSRYARQIRSAEIYCNVEPRLRTIDSTSQTQYRLP